MQQQRTTDHVHTERERAGGDDDAEMADAEQRLDGRAVASVGAGVVDADTAAEAVDEEARDEPLATPALELVDCAVSLASTSADGPAASTSSCEATLRRGVKLNSGLGSSGSKLASQDESIVSSRISVPCS